MLRGVTTVADMWTQSPEGLRRPRRLLRRRARAPPPAPRACPHSSDPASVPSGRRPRATNSHKRGRMWPVPCMAVSRFRRRWRGARGSPSNTLEELLKRSRDSRTTRRPVRPLHHPRKAGRWSVVVSGHGILAPTFETHPKRDELH